MIPNKLLILTIPIVIITSLFVLSQRRSLPASKAASELIKGVETALPELISNEATSSSQEAVLSLVPLASSVSSATSSSELLIYPNAKIKTESPTEIILESSDNSDTITSWYKDLIRKEGYRTKSFVASKTNGIVKNSLIGSKDGQSINVEISKNPDFSKVLIKIKKGNG